MFLSVSFKYLVYSNSHSNVKTEDKLKFIAVTYILVEAISLFFHLILDFTEMFSRRRKTNSVFSKYCVFSDGEMTFHQLAFLSIYDLSTCCFIYLMFHLFDVSSMCNIVTLKFCWFTVSSTRCFVNLSFHQLKIWSAWCFINLIFCQLAVLSTYYFVNLLFQQLVVLSTCCLVSLYFSTWHFINL